MCPGAGGARKGAAGLLQGGGKQQYQSGVVAKLWFPAPSDVCFLVSGMFKNILNACGASKK